MRACQFAHAAADCSALGCTESNVSLPSLGDREWNTLMYAVRHYEAALRDEERRFGPYEGPLETVREVADLGDKLLAARRADR